MRVNDIFTEDKRADIQRLQRDLNRRGATIQVDGVLGPETLLAIFKFVPEALPPDIKDKLGKIANKSNVGEPEIGRKRPRPSGGKISSTSGFKDPEFNKKLEAVAKRLGIAPEVLRAVIYAESKGVPTAKDPYGVSAGLIGFTRDTARRLGTTRDEILQMTALDQLDLVYDYFRRAGVKPGMTRGDVYMLTFMPVFLNASDDTILGKEGGGELVTPGGKSTGLSMHKVWYQNPVFGRSKGRSYFTVGDVKRHVNSLPAPDIDESINEADINPVDTIELDVPLLLRMMEYAREDAKTDMDLHDVTEKMISLSKTGEGLSMKDYESIVGGEENLGEAGNMNIPAMPNITGLQPGQAKDLGNGERVTLGADGKVHYQGGFGIVTYNQQGKALDYKTPTVGGASQTKNIATGDMTTSYQAGPANITGTANAKGQTTGFNATYKMGDASVNIDQAYKDGQPTIQTRTGTGSLNRALVKNKDAYNKAIAQQPQQEAIGGNSSEEFLKNVEYKPRHHTKPKRSLMGDPVREGHGRYWCSTDKRWKERQGPKQSRS